MNESYCSYRLNLIRHGCGLLFILFFFAGCASLPENTGRQASYALTDTNDTRLGRRTVEMMAEKAEESSESGAIILSDGVDAFAARLALTEAADRSIDAQYYMVHADLTGALFAYHLIEAADRGVRVRLLIDDIDLDKRDEAMSALSQHPNIQVRIFNPFSRNSQRLWQYLTRLGSVTRRMHNKSFTVDNQVTVVGGRNIGNEYFDADPELEFGDLDMLAVGPVVGEVSSSFDEYWNSSFAYPVHLLRPDLVGSVDLVVAREKLKNYLAGEETASYIKQLKANDLIERLEKDEQSFYWGSALVFADNPEKIESYQTTRDYSMAPALSPFFRGLEDELLIFSPYFVPGRDGTKALCELSRSGVRVRIITNSLASTDVGIVHSGYAKYRRTLLRAGVELYEVNKKKDRDSREEKQDVLVGASKASLHAKSFVLDREKVFVGSLNFDPRSFNENTEVGIMLASDEVAEMMAAGFDEVVKKAVFRLELKRDEQGFEYILWHGWENGKMRTWYHEPHTGFFNRLLIGFLRFIPFVESQL